MSFNIKPALEFLARSSFTAKSRTIEQVELIVLSRLGSVGKLASNSSVDDPIYCAIESPQGKDGLNGICFALAFTLAIVFDLRLVHCSLIFIKIMKQNSHSCYVLH